MGRSMKSNILWVTSTAVFIALLVTMQAVTAPLGNQFVTGSVVNLILIIALLTRGLTSGLAVAAISPIFAALVGVGPAFPPLVPFIALGNIVFILAWFLFGKLLKSDKPGIRYKVIGYLIAVVAALIKFLTLYAGIVLIAIPHILSLNEKQSAVLSLNFSYPQMITAVIGGIIALTVVPPIQKALRSQMKQTK